MRLFAALIAISFIFATGYLYTDATESTVTALITDKQRECSSGNSGYCQYVIYTDIETFKNVDSWWYLKFDSSDFYRELKINSTYELTVYGFRIPFFSSYRNIVDYKEKF